jgi:hypothetical protein
MKQNTFDGFTNDTNTGSPIRLSRLSDKKHASNRIKEMEGIVGILTKEEKQKRPLDKLLNGNFCIGESHQDISPKRFLIENMSKFKEHGFSVLFMEHLAADHDVDKRLSSLDKFHMDDKSSKYNFTNVVRAAEENEIEIVCLEESNDIYHQYKDGTERMVSLNYNAREVIAKKEREFHGKTGNVLKWFAFVGSAHLNTYYGVPGICEIIPNVQDVLIVDSGKIIEESEKLNVSIFINESPNQDMTIASILDRQRGEEKASEKRDRSSSDEGLSEEGLPHHSENEKEDNIKMRPLKVPKVRDSSTAPLLLNPSQTSVSKP